jgi:hypothetical protein
MIPGDFDVGASAVARAARTTNRAPFWNLLLYLRQSGGRATWIAALYNGLFCLLWIKLHSLSFDWLSAWRASALRPPLKF